MKNLFKTFSLLLLTISCKSQTPVFDIQDLTNITKDIQGAYYKDIYNQLNQFEGTYIYTNGNTSLKLVLQKKILSSMNGYYYEDLIIGEYQYIKNGVETANTLNKLLINYPNKSNHSIDGRTILVGRERGCSDCLINEKRLEVGIVDVQSNSTGSIQIRKALVGTQEAIKIFVSWRITPRKTTDPVPSPLSIPSGEYILIKQ